MGGIRVLVFTRGLFWDLHSDSLAGGTPENMLISPKPQTQTPQTRSTSSTANSKSELSARVTGP